jgi:hypothetical protein
VNSLPLVRTRIDQVYETRARDYHLIDFSHDRIEKTRKGLRLLFELRTKQGGCNPWGDNRYILNRVVTHAPPFGEKAARECATARCGEQSLAASDALVHQDFNLNPTVLGPPGLCLVRRCWSVLAHGTRRDDMPCRHVGLLHQVSDHGFCTVLA